MVIDNFALTMGQSCPAKFDLRMNQGWSPRRKSGALGFGAALHEGLAAWYRSGGKIEDALMAIKKSWPENHPDQDWRTMEKCAQVMLEYARHYGSESFRILGYPENPQIENHFALDTGRHLPICGRAVVDPDTHLRSWVPGCNYDNTDEFLSNGDLGICHSCGKPLDTLEYGGIFDGIVEFAGRYFILEHKSTSQLGAYYFDQFKPNNQVSGYIWGARQLSGQPVGGAIINAIGIYRASPTKFIRQITTRTDHELEVWLDNVWFEAANLQRYYATGYWPQRTQACTLYGKCEFHNVHVLSHEREQQLLLEQDYVREEWDFVRRDEPGTAAV